MAAYILRRILLIFPTLFGIMLLNFLIIQFIPGGPIEQIMAQVEDGAHGATDRFAGGGEGGGAAAQSAAQAGGGEYRGSRGLDQDYVDALRAQWGLDQPLPVQFATMMLNYATFDFGESFFKSRGVIELIIDKLPVSITLGLWSLVITYLVSIPIGIRKAVRDGSRFDVVTSSVIVVAYSIPIVIFAVTLRSVFAGDLGWFPLRGIVSDNWREMGTFELIRDYFWHITLPVLASTISGFATLTLLTKNSFLDEIRKQYVVTAKAKGISSRQVLYGHVFRNAMLIVVAGFPGAFISVFIAGSIFIETAFSLDGLGLLGYEAVVQRDYPIVLGTTFLFGLIGLFIKLVSDLVYVMIDPRIDFGAREG